MTARGGPLTAQQKLTSATGDYKMRINRFAP
jgi:hypothetical protein